MASSSSAETATETSNGRPAEKFSMDWKEFSWSWLIRKKKYAFTHLGDTKLARVLGLIELTALGTGGMLGAGIYVVAPGAAQNHSGPALFLSFIIAGIAAMFSGLCYAEMGARLPRAGSAYIYSYVSVGELWAFIVGWNLILEYVIGAASVARAAVTYMDVLFNGIFSATFSKALPINLPGLGEYFDPMAFGLTIALTVILALGVRESTTFNNFLVLLNVAITLYIIIVGPFYVDPTYWNFTAEEVQWETHSTSFGTGGFMPYGFGGVVTAASSAFYAFIGFDIIATTGEEVEKPQRNIPLSIIFSIFLCIVCYVGMSIVFTMMTPYFALDPSNLLARVPYGAQTVAGAALLGVLTNLLGLMFPMPRVIMAMAEDGLLFAFLARVNSYFKTPFIATFLSGLLTALFAAIFDVDELVNMLSIGTLCAYSMVAASVLVLRYREQFIDTSQTEIDGPLNSSLNQPEILDDIPINPRNVMIAVFDFKRYGSKATPFTSMVATTLIIIASLTTLVSVTFLMVQTNLVVWPVWWPLVLISLFGIITLIICIRLWLLPQNLHFHTFKVPFVPFVPVLALAVNFYLLVSLDQATWIRFAVWMAIGAFLYVFYGIWASQVRHDEKAEQATAANTLIRNTNPIGNKTE